MKSNDVAGIVTAMEDKMYMMGVDEESIESAMDALDSRLSNNRYECDPMDYTLDRFDSLLEEYLS